MIREKNKIKHYYSVQIIELNLHHIRKFYLLESLPYNHTKKKESST